MTTSATVRSFATHSILKRFRLGNAYGRSLIMSVCAVLILGVTSSSHAIDSETLEDPVLQIRYVAISKELRCLVCQNQSIYDSNADLAKDLRRQVREMLLAGRADDEIYRYMIERYGDYVRYRPPWRINTLLLQLGPVFIALLGLWMLWGTLRKHRGNGAHSLPPASNPQPRNAQEPEHE